MRYVFVVLIGMLMVSCSGSNSQSGDVHVAFRLAEVEPKEGFTAMVCEASGDTLYLHEEDMLTHEDIVSASVIAKEPHPEIEVTFTKEARERFARATGAHIGSRMGIIVDGILVSSPKIMATINGGVAHIVGRFSQEEARRIAEGIH